MLPELVIGIITIDIAFKVISKSAVIGDYILYSGLLVQLWAAMTQAISSGMEVYDNKMKVDSVQSLKYLPKKIQNSIGDNIQKIYSIEFFNVSFKYPKTNKFVLKDISFKVHEKEKLAIVGINGSGKSTLIKLMLRFYDPTTGEIHVNGKNIKDYNLDNIRQCFDGYFQNSINFGFSIRENIAVSNTPYISDDEIENAMYNANADSILLEAPDKLDTYLTRMFDDKGIELSGGEHQKIALARAFVRNKRTIILDEPSSSLDPESESKVFEAIKVLSKEKMTIFTSHRLSNVFMADRIIVLENGKIVEDGTQKELLESKKRFSELYNLQMQKFSKDA